MIRAAKEQSLALTGPNGLLKQLTKSVLETALNEEVTEHLGYEKHDQARAGAGSIRYGTPLEDGPDRHVGAGADRRAAGSGTC